MQAEESRPEALEYFQRPQLVCGRRGHPESRGTESYK